VRRANATFLISCGAIQYMDDPLPRILMDLQELPRWIIINKVMVTSGTQFWTLQNFGTGICPCQVFNENEFTNILRNTATSSETVGKPQNFTSKSGSNLRPWCNVGRVIFLNARPSTFVRDDRIAQRANVLVRVDARTSIVSQPSKIGLARAPQRTPLVRCGPARRRSTGNVALDALAKAGGGMTNSYVRHAILVGR